MNFKKTFLGIFGMVVLWQTIHWANIFNPIFFASPFEVILEFYEMIFNLEIFLDLLHTFYRLFLSISIACVFGIPLGILLGYYSRSYEYFEEIIDFFRSIPPIVIYPILLIALGPGDASRIGVAAFGSLTVLILIISKGLFQQSILRRKYFLALGLSKKEVLKKIIFYESLPHIMTGLRTSVSLSIIIIVVTEMLVGARYGLGTRVQNVQITSNIPDLFATIIIIGFMGIILNKILVYLDKKFIFWRINY